MIYNLKSYIFLIRTPKYFVEKSFREFQSWHFRFMLFFRVISSIFFPFYSFLDICSNVISNAFLMNVFWRGVGSWWGIVSRTTVVLGSVGGRVGWGRLLPPTNRLLRAFFVLLSERFLLAGLKGRES